MNTGHFSAKSQSSPASRGNSLSRKISFGVVRSVALLALLGLALTGFYSRSSASRSNNGLASSQSPTVLSWPRADSASNGVNKTAGLKSVPMSSIGALPLAPVLGSLETFAADCTTPKSVFAVGDTVCVRASGISLGSFFPRRLNWATTDSTVVRSTNITSDPQTDSLLITATSDANGRTVDNRGTWLLIVQNPFFFFPEALATFTVTDPANPSADVGVSSSPGANFVAAGSQAVFQIQVDNLGPDSSTNVDLTDAVPADTTFVSFQQISGPVFACSNPADGGTGSTTCSIASLPANSSASFIATYLVNNGVSVGTEIINAASVASTTVGSTPATSDPNSLNDSGAATEIVAAAPCALTCPSNIDVPADSGSAGAVVSYAAPSSTGDCGTPITGEGGEVTPPISCSPESGSFFPAGTTTVVCSGQTGGVCTFLVTVENPGSLSITLNGANPFALECGDDFTDPGATAVDGTGNSVTVDISGTVNIHTPGSYTVTYTATEGANSTSTTRTVNVSDSAGPVINIAGSNPLTVGCGSTFTDPGVSAEDACEGSKTVSSSGTVNTSVPGTYTITYTASDSQNRTSTATRTVIVEAGSNAPPNITLNGDPEITAECGSFTDPGATAMIPCGGSVPVTTTSNINPHAPGTYTITYTACVEDTPGHCDPARTSSVDRTVVIEDNAAPTITVNGANPLQVECHGTFTDPGATAHDACAGDFAATASGTVDTTTVGQYTVTYNATDPSGHAAASVTRTVNVVDTTAPVITTCPAAQSANANSSCQAAVPNFTGSAAASDLCGGAVTFSQSPAAGTIVGAGVTTVTITAKDIYNNSSTCTTTFTVNDTTPPTISCPAGITTGTDPNSCSAVVNPGTPTASDNCGSPSVAGVRSDGQSLSAPYPKGTTTITWTATDGAGNHTSCTQTITVNDTQAPAISCPASIIAPFNPGVNGAVVNYTTPVGTDNCPGATTTRTAGLASGATFPLGKTTVTYTVTDAAGLSSSCSFTVTVALTSLIGLDSVSITGSGYADSYNSSGGYPATKASTASVVSNGTITIGNSGKVWGSVRSTRAGINMSGASQVTGNATAGTNVSLSGSASVGGTITNNALAPLFTLPSVGACGPPYSSNSGISGTYSYNSSTGDLSLSGVNIATLANGNYCFHNVTLTNSAQLKVNGPVVIKLTGTFNASGATNVNNTTAVPANLKMLSSYSGTTGITLGNSTSTYLVIYAPTTGVSVSGAVPLFGTVAGKTLSITGSGAVHYDTQLQSIWPDLWALLP